MQRKKTKWDIDKLTFLKQNYIAFGGRFCAEKLDVSIQSIRQMTGKLKLKRINYKQWTTKDIEFLNENYGRYGSRFCARELGMNIGRVRRKARSLKITKTPLPLDSKTCTRCKKEKSLDNFSPHSTGRLGLYPSCKSCNSKAVVARRRNSVNLQILHTISNRIRMAIKTNVKAGRSLDMLGCSIPFFKDYISAKFLNGMSWENHGLWHIDHIRPCCSFDLTNLEEQKKCFHYTNLQPLWAKDNIAKGKKYN